MVTTRGYAPHREKLYERNPVLFYPVCIWVYWARLTGIMKRG